MRMMVVSLIETGEFEILCFLKLFFIKNICSLVTNINYIKLKKKLLIYCSRDR